MNRKTKDFEYLEKLYNLKCEAIATEVKDIRDMYLEFNFTFKQANEFACRETNYLRDRVNKMNSTKMYKSLKYKNIRD